jgi:plasmid maintenance system antidote protein VapI
MKLRVRKYRILEIMDAKGIDSIKDLAEQLDIQATNISTLLNNKTNFRREYAGAVDRDTRLRIERCAGITS